MSKYLLTLLFTTTFLYSAGQSITALQNVSIVPMTSEKVLNNQTVLIIDGIITRIGKSGKIKIPRGAMIIDCNGKYLIPGLFDMHAHFFEEQGEHRNTNEAELKVMLANGLTTVRIMAGHPSYLQARENVQNKNWIGPDLVVASPQFVGRWPWMPDFKNYEVVNSLEKARNAVIKYKQEGYDEIKLTFMVTQDVYNEVIKTAKEVGIKVTGHVGPQVKLDAALAAQQQIEHMDEFIDQLLPDTSYNHGQSVSDMNIWRENAWATVPYLDETKISALVQKVKDAGIYVTPTNYFFFSSFGHGMSDEVYKLKPDYEFIPENLKKERWEIKERYWSKAAPKESRDKYVQVRQKITKALWEAGVPLMAGSDSPEWFLVQGFSIHDELATFVNAGLTPFAALQTATVNTAKYLGVFNSKGTIESGKQADLILLDGNPLENIAHTRKIIAVFKNGTHFPAQKLSALLKESKNVIHGD